jgi:hypothetical protein
MKLELNAEELAITYSALEDCLNSDDWSNLHLLDSIDGIMQKIKTQLKKPKQ